MKHVEVIVDSFSALLPGGSCAYSCFSTGRHVSPRSPPATVASRTGCTCTRFRFYSRSSHAVRGPWQWSQHGQLTPTFSAVSSTSRPVSAAAHRRGSWSKGWGTLAFRYALVNFLELSSLAAREAQLWFVLLHAAGGCQVHSGSAFSVSQHLHSSSEGLEASL